MKVGDFFEVVTQGEGAEHFYTAGTVVTVTEVGTVFGPAVHRVVCNEGLPQYVNAESLRPLAVVS